MGVSFVTVNSWINGRSVPRAKALVNIDKLYLDIVGVDEVDPESLALAKQDALRLRTTAKSLVADRELLDKLTLYLTYHTNTIEGSTMTLSDVKGVIFEHKVLTNRTSIEQAEARNHQAALYWLIDEVARNGEDCIVNEDLILGVHLRLMNGIVGDAGQYRRRSVHIAGFRVPLANWVKIPSLINELAANPMNPSEDTIAVLAHTHARFEKIHPFSDGNGRTGRLVMPVQALKAGLVPPLVIKERKYAYYKYLELAQTKNDYKPLELFIAESIKFTDALLRSNTNFEL